MDILYIEAIVRELRSILSGASLNKVYQPGTREIILRLWNGRANLRLILSVAPGASRLHLTERRLPNPPSPPRFAQLLRSRLHRLQEIEQGSGERVVRFHFTGEEKQRWTLVAELFGAQGNLILLDHRERIVDALVRVERQGRGVLPGRPYIVPERPSLHDLAQGVPEIPADLPFRSWLEKKVSPMTPLIAANLAVGVDRGLAPEKVLSRFRDRWLAGDFTPAIVTWGGRPVLSAFVPEYLVLGGIQTFSSPSEGAEAFYGAVSEEELFDGGRGALEKVVRKGLRRLEKRLLHIETEEKKARQSQRQRQLGDLLLANLHRLRKGMTAIALDDWYADPPEPVTVPLDPSLSPEENANTYFRRHRKGKRALEHIARRRKETLGEKEWLEGVALALEEAAEADDFQEIRRELEAAGLIQARPTTISRRKEGPAAPAVRQATSPGGYTLYWGRNNRSNDHVSRQLTGPGDLWFHAHHIPGCHLVLKCGSQSGEVPDEDILFAAAIAAAHSRGKDDTRVEVMVAEGKAVRKPKGARPGLVTVENYRTVAVRPIKESGIRNQGPET